MKIFGIILALLSQYALLARLFSFYANTRDREPFLLPTELRAILRVQCSCISQQHIQAPPAA